MTGVIAASRTPSWTPLEGLFLSDGRRASGSLLKSDGSASYDVVHHEDEDRERREHGEDTCDEGRPAEQLPRHRQGRADVLPQASVVGKSYSRTESLGYPVRSGGGEAAQSGLGDLLDRGKLLSERLAPRTRQPVRAATLLLGERLNETPCFEPSQCPIQGPGPEANTCQPGDIRDHRVPVLRPARETCEDQQSGTWGLPLLAGMPGHAVGSSMTVAQYCGAP
jgi:hypothetical protein